MIKLPAILSAMFLFSGFSGADEKRNNPDNLIEWSEAYKLCWDDFRGEVNKKSFGDAATAVYIKAKPFYINKKITYTVHAFFVRNESWTREKSESLLAHEQLHFDIAELYARKARKKIQELDQRGVNDLKVYNAAVQQILDESNDIDRQYDGETLHGAITERQSNWAKKVTDELAGLSEFRKR